MAVPGSYNIGSNAVVSTATFANENNKEVLNAHLKAKNVSQSTLSTSEEHSEKGTKHKKSKIEKMPSEENLEEKNLAGTQQWPPAAISRIKDVYSKLSEKSNELNAAKSEIETLKNQLLELKKLQESHSMQIEQIADEKQATEVSKDISVVKQVLTKLNSDINGTITLILNAVMKNEIPKEYNENEKDLYEFAKKAFENSAGIQTTITQRLQDEKKPFSQIILKRNDVFDNWNSSQVLVERVNHNVKFLEQILAMPDHLKNFSNKVTQLSKKVNTLIERDFIDSANFEVLGKIVKEENANIDDKQKLIEIKRKYDKFLIPVRQEALKIDHSEFATLLNDIITFKETHFDAALNNTSTDKTVEALSIIKNYFKLLNDKVRYWKEQFTTNISDEYEIYRSSKKDELTTELKQTQESFLKNHSELREWCSKTWNQALNELAIVNCKIELLEDKINVYNEMKQTQANMDILKGKALDALRTLKGVALKNQQEVLEPDFYSYTKTMENHSRNYQELVKKYQTTIDDITKKLSLNHEVAFKKEMDNQALFPEMPKEKILKNVVDTHTVIRDLAQKQLDELKSQWESLFTKRYYDTAKDFDKIEDSVNPKSILKIMGDTTGATTGKYTQEWYNIRDGKPVSTGTLTTSTNATTPAVTTPAVPTPVVTTQEPVKQ